MLTFFCSTHHCADKNNERYTVNYALNGLCTENLFMISIHIHTLLLPNLNIHTLAFRVHSFFFSSPGHRIIHKYSAKDWDVCISIVYWDWGRVFFFLLSFEGNFFFSLDLALIGNLDACLDSYFMLHRTHFHTHLQFRENLLEFDPILKHLLKIGRSGFNRVSFFFYFHFIYFFLSLQFQFIDKNLFIRKIKLDSI